MFLYTRRARASSLALARLAPLAMLLLNRGGCAFQHHGILAQRVLRATCSQRAVPPQATVRASLSVLSMSWDGDSISHESSRSGGRGGGRGRQDVDRSFGSPNTVSTSTPNRRSLGGRPRPRHTFEEGGRGGSPREGWGSSSSQGRSGRGGRGRGRGGGRDSSLRQRAQDSGRATKADFDTRESGPMRWQADQQQDQRARRRGGGDDGDARSFGGRGRGRRGISGNRGGFGGSRDPGNDYRGSGQGERGRRGERGRVSTDGRARVDYKERTPRDSRGGPAREQIGLDDVLDQYRTGGLGVGVNRDGDDEGDMCDGAEYDDSGGGAADGPASDWMKDELSDFQAELAAGMDGADENLDIDMVYGIAPVLNALRNTRREMLGLYIQDGLTPGNKKDRNAANKIYDIARENDVIMTVTDKGYLNTLCGNRPHQGFVLKARKLQFEPILFLPPIPGMDSSQAVAPITKTTATTQQDGENADEGDDDEDNPQGKGEESTKVSRTVEAAPGQVWLALDEVTDPQNFGALLRSAHFFGASGIVTCAKNSASLTAAVSKASAGAAEVMRIHSTANMMRFLKRSRENGWRIVGTAVNERSITLHELSAGAEAPPTVVVLGNEGYGVRPNVLRECDLLVEVEGEGGGALAAGAKPSTVDSLNVSVTGGVMLFHLMAAVKFATAAGASRGETVVETGEGAATMHNVDPAMAATGVEGDVTTAAP